MTRKDALKNAPVPFSGPPGRFVIEVTRAWETKAKNGWNFHWEGKIVEPMAFKGTPIHRVFAGGVRRRGRR